MDLKSREIVVWKFRPEELMAVRLFQPENYISAEIRVGIDVSGYNICSLAVELGAGLYSHYGGTYVLDYGDTEMLILILTEDYQRWKKAALQTGWNFQATDDEVCAGSYGVVQLLSDGKTFYWRPQTPAETEQICKELGIVPGIITGTSRIVPPTDEKLFDTLVKSIKSSASSIEEDRSLDQISYLVNNHVNEQNYLTILGGALDGIGWDDAHADRYTISTFGVEHWDSLSLQQGKRLVSHILSILIHRPDP